MNNKRFKQLSLEIFEDEGIKINNIDEIRDLLLNQEDISLKCSIAYFVAEYKIQELQDEVIKIACSDKAKNHCATFIFASRQFDCSKYFNIYIALILQRSYHCCLECFSAIKKCKNITEDELIYAKKALEAWYYFYDTPYFIDNEIVAKSNLINKICKHLEKRIITTAGQESVNSK